MKKTIISFLILVFSVALYGAYVHAQQDAAPTMPSPNTLKSQIDARNKELDQIRQEQLQLQRDINAAVGEQQTLQAELNRIAATIRQLNLGIRASELTIEKLGFEIEQLEISIAEARDAIAVNKDSMAEVVKQMYQNEHEPPLIVFLKYRTLSEGFGKLQSLNALTSELTIKLRELDRLQQELEESLAATTEKKNEQLTEHAALSNRKRLLANQEVYQKDLLVETRNQESRYRAMMEELREQQEAIAREIDTLEEELRKQINPAGLPSARAGVLAWPVKGNGILTQGYGATSFARYNYASRWHNGVDIASPLGTPLLAAEDGIVVEMWDQDRYCYRGAYGKFIVLQHSNNLTTLYTHLSAFLPTLNVGDTIKRGEVVGYMGTTGRSTGSHLHFTVYDSSTFRIGPAITCGPKMPFGGDLNPMDYLSTP